MLIRRTIPRKKNFTCGPRSISQQKYESIFSRSIYLFSRLITILFAEKWLDTLQASLVRRFIAQDLVDEGTEDINDTQYVKKMEKIARLHAI